MRRPLLLVSMLLLASPAAHAMRCGNALVGDGMQDVQVRARCGEPFWIDRYANVEVLGARGPLERQREVQFDVWYYNFGPRQLMRRLVFRDGVLLREDTLGYGVEAIGVDCAPNRVLADLSVGELVALCGTPASRRDLSETLVRRPAPGVELWRDRRHEEWLYDFGDARLLRRVQLVDGRVTAVDALPR
ncbi:MAG: DUF2845 domain-containing protein [Rhodanobacteraceae bacterium]|jgi:hypothetical protein|nr:DUF2845 domain-containing protein [Rhodanobacteraceae bacterium]